MKGKGEKRTDLFGKIYRWLSYLVALSFIIIGGGILIKLLLPDPFPLTATQRWVMGLVILGYGIARTIAIFLKYKKAGKNNDDF
jgi:hypothetical protein